MEEEEEEEEVWGQQARRSFQTDHAFIFVSTTDAWKQIKDMKEKERRE